MECQGQDSGKWAMRHDRCRRCGTTDQPHRAKGLCKPCYNAEHNARLRKKPGGRRVGPRGPSLKSQIPEQLLEELYNGQQLSLQDIADRYGCTRVLVYFLMKEYGIPRRSRSKARRIAQRAGKVEYTVQLASGGTRQIRQAGTNINATFFREWSPEMAFVLGVFYTDGCLSRTPNGYYCASISQKEPELLEKCLALMNCDARLSYKPNNSRTGDLYTFTISHQGTCRDLVSRGLHPRKSLTIQFPDMPTEALRHFIRGCWDGDGCICKCGNAWRASYYCGSRAFISGLLEALVLLGMPTVRIHRDRSSRVYRINWNGSRTGQLARVLYTDVPSTQYLARKYVRFSLAAREAQAPTA